MPETLAERIAEKLAPQRMCQVPGMDDVDLAEDDYNLCLKAIQDFAREAVRQIRAEANSIEEAILILKAAGGEG